MKKLTLGQLEKKYSLDKVKRFERNNNRPGRGMDDGSFLGDIKERGGFTMQDQALRWGARRGTVIARFKSKLSTEEDGRTSSGPGAAAANPAALITNPIPGLTGRHCGLLTTPDGLTLSMSKWTNCLATESR